MVRHVFGSASENASRHVPENVFGNVPGKALENAPGHASEMRQGIHLKYVVRKYHGIKKWLLG